ncbi:broad-complex core protein isoforms 1/2/3/4/5 isoform X1 [Sabethes cyaneus]|uniref:broad-complex core protein isoforms 1/2/3/4/5 isoform X1 n=1 Tax=Sabethes cyaneus TaxID=53552 RepID=UPI00237DE925|nr:broad-complex core protein isoforms 1/2/3/4/5 isoform X1 [Sabethes cyaneus]XP_053682332.1 broad-complex core protein isoforms 1/2/3/4/5 isoform X1 [Sabethes cyaneus]
MDEFALCWNNFADNIASGFQNLYDRGDLVDVTIACDRKLLKAHKIVLAICSPYFQEMFMTNPCKHPIIVLKDVSVNVMQELLQFMYQGEVNVKHTELQSFMKIAETLQIKGLTASHKNDRSSTPQSQPAPAHSNSTNSNNNNNSQMGNLNRHSLKDLAGGPSTSQLDPSKLNSYLAAAAKESLKRAAADGPYSGGAPDYPSIYSSQKKAFKRSTDSIDQESNSDCMDNLSSDEVFMATSPQISMIEHSSSSNRQFDLSAVKRENPHDSFSSPPRHSPTNLATSAAAMGSSAAAAVAAGMKLGFASTPTHHPALHPMFGAFDHSASGGFSGMASSLAASIGASGSGNGGTGGTAGGGVGAGGMSLSGKGPTGADYASADYSQDFGKGIPGHMDIPAGPSITMLSSTSLLHNNCIFNRNNTVATQQGLKTYWLCKSYRVSMCRARCITHHGQVISSTGVHNHPPHMKGPNEFPPQQSIPPTPPAPPPPQPNIGPPPGGPHAPHHGHLNHLPQQHMNGPQIVAVNGGYDPNQDPRLHYQTNPMGPPLQDPQYPHHQLPAPYSNSHSFPPHPPPPPLPPQQPYISAPAMPPPTVQQQQHPPPAPETAQPSISTENDSFETDVIDIKLTQLQPSITSHHTTETGTTTVTQSTALLGDSATDSMLPPPPQPPTATLSDDQPPQPPQQQQQLQLKTEQLS